MKYALVCGGSKGIGLACAQLLAANGISVTLLARRAEELQKACEQLPTVANASHNFIACDVNDLDQLTDLVESQIAHGRSYTILINNSGGPAAGPIVSAKAEEFIAAFQQHLIVNHRLASILIPIMKDASHGRIVNIISTSVKQPLPNLGVSNTIRAAVANWSKTLATELASFGITVNNVLPGATATDRLDAIIQNKAAKTNKSEQSVREEMLHEIPARRFAKPEEIAAAAAFLCSDAAAYITGINLPVDGGRTGNL